MTFAPPFVDEVIIRRGVGDKVGGSEVATVRVLVPPVEKVLEVGLRYGVHALVEG